MNLSDKVWTFCSSEITKGWIEYYLEIFYGFINFITNSIITMILFKIINKVRSKSETDNKILGIKIGLISEYINTMLTIQILLMKFKIGNLMNLLGDFIGTYVNFSI